MSLAEPFWVLAGPLLLVTAPPSIGSKCISARKAIEAFSNLNKRFDPMRSTTKFCRPWPCGEGGNTISAADVENRKEQQKCQDICFSASIKSSAFTTEPGKAIPQYPEASNRQALVQGLDDMLSNRKTSDPDLTSNRTSEHTSGPSAAASECEELPVAVMDRAIRRLGGAACGAE